MVDHLKINPFFHFASKVKPAKASVLGVIGFHGVVQAIPFDANYTAAIFLACHGAYYPTGFTK